ncbi:MAG TPA: radical SAM protein [Vicinamibacterales bacterium]|nr:radical SAM protein [Vicinamibacterales bacterium]
MAATTSATPRQSLDAGKMLTGFGRLLRGYSPLLSIEITRECPLRCPGCYAYGDEHLGGGVTLRGLRDFTGDALVDGVLAVIRERKPMQVSFVGGEPLIRHRELSRILPVLDAMGVYSLVVTSAVIPFPAEWNALKRVRVTVSIDGLQPEHDERRKPATYKKILENLQGRTADVSWVVTNQMLERDGYLEEYLAFWAAQPSIERIWLSVYTPQKGEISAERLTPASRARLLRELPALKKKYPALIFPDGALQAFASPPAGPAACTFARISSNVSADLKTKIEPCFFGGNPDCSECGCAVSAGLHWLHGYPLAAGLTAGHLIDLALAIGRHPRRQVPPRMLPMVPAS